MSYRLSICIPTFNRDVYLESLLARIAEETAGLEEVVQIVISDNASTDRTHEVARRHAGQPNVHYERRPKNIGPDANFIAVVDAAGGEYCWIFGDDDVMLPGAVQTVLRSLDEWSPDLMHVSTDKLRFVDEATPFPSFNEFVRHFARVRPRTVLDVTLITTAIFRRAVWDSVDHKERFLPTRYMHSLVLAEALAERGTVVVIPDAVISVRLQAAAEDARPSGFRFRHVQYLLALVHMTGSVELDRYSRAERMHCLRAHGWTFIGLTYRYLANTARLASMSLRALFLRRRALAAALALPERGRDSDRRVDRSQ